MQDGTGQMHNELKGFPCITNHCSRIVDFSELRQIVLGEKLLMAFTSFRPQKQPAVRQRGFRRASEEQKKSPFELFFFTLPSLKHI